jgi:hypothetical protein
VFGPDFAASYSATSLGSVTGVPGSYGGLLFRAGDPNTLFVGGNAAIQGGGVYAVPVVRGADGHITGFGAATLYASARGIDGGLQYGPNGSLLYADQLDNSMGEIKPGSGGPDKQVLLVPLNIRGFPGGLVVAPPGFAPPNHIKFLTTFGFKWYNATLTDDGNGTYDLTNVGPAITLPFSPEAALYVPGGTPGFARDSVLIDSWGPTQGLIAYQVDANGDPILSTARNFASRVIGNSTTSGPEGAAFDTVTGDLLVSTLGSSPDLILEFRGFPVPEPSLAVGIVSLEGLALARRRARPPRRLQKGVRYIYGIHRPLAR